MLNIFGRQDRYGAALEFYQAGSQPSVHYRAFQQKHTLLVSTPQPEEKYYWLARQQPSPTLRPPLTCPSSSLSQMHVLTQCAYIMYSLDFARFAFGGGGREVENMKRLENRGQMWADRVGVMEVDLEQRVKVRNLRLSCRSMHCWIVLLKPHVGFRQCPLSPQSPPKKEPKEEGLQCFIIYMDTWLMF